MERGVARPTQWNDKRTQQAFELALLGASEEQMSRVMGISIKTFEYWKRTKPEFLEKLNEGRMAADSKVAAAFFRKCTGYTYKKQHVSIFKGVAVVTEVEEHVGPDAWSCMKWLASRQRNIWADVQKVENTQTNININKFDFSGLTTEELMVIKKAGLRQLTENVRDFADNQN